MSSHSDFKRQFVSIITQRKKNTKIGIPKIKLNRITEFPCASFIIKRLEHFQKITGFLKPFCPSVWKRSHIHFILSEM